MNNYESEDETKYILTATVMTPSFPTFSIALAISSPISRSPLAEIVAT